MIKIVKSAYNLRVYCRTIFQMICDEMNKRYVFDSSEYLS